jgi:hypothetical protein
LSPNFTGRQGSLACFLGILRQPVDEGGAAAQFVGTRAATSSGRSARNPS